jgi:hypothetical protein
MTKNSKFLLGLYGQVWIITQSFVQDWVKQLMRLNRMRIALLSKGVESYGSYTARALASLSPRELNYSS